MESQINRLLKCLGVLREMLESDEGLLEARHCLAVGRG